MTKNRQKIYDCITGGSAPLNASQIYQKTGAEMDLATIYRGLQFLEEKKMISSFVFSCQDRVMERYYTQDEAEHTHYMHCRICHNFFPLPRCPFKDKLDRMDDMEGFLVESHSISLMGICRDCR